MRRRFLIWHGLILVLLLPGRAALAAEGGGASPAVVAGRDPAFTLAIMGGLSVPACMGQSPCEGSIAAAPAIEGLALFQPTPAVAVGLVAQLARVRWEATYLGQIAGAPPATARSTLTAGFAGVAARFTLLADRAVNPIVLLAAGSTFQSQSQPDFGCGRELVVPTGQLGIGASARVSPSISLLAMAAVTAGVKLTNCQVIDGPPLPPLAAWGLSFQAGAAFDVGPTASPAP